MAGLVALVGAALALAGSTLAAPAPETTVTTIEGEVMCPICGTLLELSDSPQAQREKVYIAKLVAAGKSRAEIKDALVAQYGPEVLAVPRGSGFDLTAYLVPIVALLAAIAAIAVAVSRWRRDGGDAGEPEPALPDEDAERLDADIARYDL
ncbi:MAG: cytochrome c-type biogenesis protein CcmH [Chloroflexota bacterium]